MTLAEGNPRKNLKMSNSLILLFCLIGIAVAQESTGERTLVTAPIGKIQGSILTSRLGKKIYSFRGVRYAESPTGPRRFQPPVPAEDWKNVFDATEEGPSCPHPSGKLISEDCLRLNVYTTRLPCENENVSRPVMVFIHPGGFYGFSGQSITFGPEYLMDKDIVLVTINYRLGSLGFLSTGDGRVPGNMGLKDQVVALRWIQRNIAAFGGNPNSVTLCGYSAGSFSIMLHMVSPMSKNLFHRGIGMSASAMGSDVYSIIAQNGQAELAKKQARLLDCPTSSSEAMMACLNTKPMENFTSTQSKMFDWYQTPILLWQPTVEPEIHGAERFLTEQPYDLIKRRKFHQIPLILGVTEDEFGGIVVFYEKGLRENNGSVYAELDNGWRTIAPIVFQYERNTPRSHYISDELKQYYFKGRPIGSATVQQLADIYADSIITFPMYRSAKILATYSDEPVYFYKFKYPGRQSFYMWNDTTPYGTTTHHEDLQYLFFMKQFFRYIDVNDPEYSMVQLYTAMWTNFMKKGEPIPKDDEKFRSVTWSRFVPARNNFLEINLNPTMKTDFFPDRMRLWERLFPLPTSSSSVKH